MGKHAFMPVCQQRQVCLESLTDDLRVILHQRVERGVPQRRPHGGGAADSHRAHPELEGAFQQVVGRNVAEGRRHHLFERETHAADNQTQMKRERGEVMSMRGVPQYRNLRWRRAGTSTSARRSSGVRLAADA